MRLTLNCLFCIRERKDEKKRQQWQDSINNYFNSNRIFGKYAWVCALHFAKDCFNNNGMMQRVTFTKTATPTIFCNFRKENNSEMRSQLEHCE